MAFGRAVAFTQAASLPRRVCIALAAAAPSAAVLAAAGKARAAASTMAAPTTSAASAAVSYDGRERLLAYGNAGKAEKIRRRLAILEQEAKRYIKDFDQAVKDGNVQMQDCCHYLWKEVDEKIQLLQSDPDKYERKYGL
ncbi:hypothetical protein ABPG75_008549 [Micractinium tetrahymenae]